MRFLGFLFALVGIGAALFFLFGTVVPPGYMGLRQIYLGPGAGYSKHGLKPGLHFTLPFYSQIHFLPATVQVLNFTKGEAGSLGNVKTKDGALVDVDVTVLYTLFHSPSDDQGGPADLIKAASLDPRRWNNIIARDVQPLLKNSLSNLSTSSFYDPAQRQKQVDAAQTAIRQKLQRYGLNLQGVLIRRYTYQNEGIDYTIFQKNLQEQELRLNDARTKLWETKAKLEQVEAQLDAKVKTLEVQGENEARVLMSEGDLYESEQRAKGDLEVARAIAEVDRLKASALASAEGADIYVARKIAPLVGSLKGGVVTNVDPYNVDDWTKRLGVDQERK